MSMIELLNLKFFRLLSEPSQQVTKQEILEAYEAFVKQVTETSYTETDHSKVFRMLNHSRLELDSLRTSPLYELGGGYIKD